MFVKTNDSVFVTTSSGVKYKATHVILAIPPHQILQIDFTPALPYAKSRLYQHMPVGHIIKVIITYRKVKTVSIFAYNVAYMLHL